MREPLDRVRFHWNADSPSLYTEAARAWPSAEASPTQTSEQGAEQASHRHSKSKSCCLNYFLSFKNDGLKISLKYRKVLERHVVSDKATGALLHVKSVTAKASAVQKEPCIESAIMH